MLGSPATNLLADPKSHIFNALFSKLTNMFYGLISLWHIPIAYHEM